MKIKHHIVNHPVMLLLDVIIEWDWKDVFSSLFHKVAAVVFPVHTHCSSVTWPTSLHTQVNKIDEKLNRRGTLLNIYPPFILKGLSWLGKASTRDLYHSNASEDTQYQSSHRSSRRDRWPLARKAEENERKKESEWEGVTRNRRRREGEYVWARERVKEGVEEQAREKENRRD